MAICPKCGAASAQDSAFCGACGQPMGSQVGAAAVSRSARPGITGESTGTGLTTNLAAALAYVLGAITGIVFLLLEPYKANRFVRFHALQSIFFSIACVIFSVVWSMVWGTLASILGYWVLTVDVPLRLLIGLALFGFWLYVMYQAYTEREYHIPWIGDLAAKQVG